MNGQARQKKLPANSSTNTNAPRKWTHVNVVARFCGANGGPNSPCRTIATLITNNGICSNVRACFFVSSLPASGTRRRSNGSLCSNCDTDLNYALLRCDAIDLELLVQLTTVNQSYMSHNDPISSHRELERRAVISFLYFRRVRKHGSHACM